MADDKAYKAFIKHAQGHQRAYIREEAKRMDRAEKLLWKLKDDFGKLGLHVLTLDEVNARRRELSGMLVDVPTTHADSPTMRFAFSQTLKGDRQAE